ncbi:DUF2279 domain-containing protein [candidate division KSB1 bacterium]|nr:DUF2279 domain-containing protein [candidate division KSB1 bacterium]
MRWNKAARRGIFSGDKWIGKDKIDHALASAFITSLSYMLLRDQMSYDNRAALYVSSSICFSIGAAKEIWDSQSKKGVASAKDLVWNIFGIGLGVFICSSR